MAQPLAALSPSLSLRVLDQCSASSLSASEKSCPSHPPFVSFLGFLASALCFDSVASRRRRRQFDKNEVRKTESHKRSGQVKVNHLRRLSRSPKITEKFTGYSRSFIEDLPSAARGFDGPRIRSLVPCGDVCGTLAKASFLMSTLHAGRTQHGGRSSK